MVMLYLVFGGLPLLFGILFFREGVGLLRTGRSPNREDITQKQRPFRFWIEVVITFCLSMFCLAGGIMVAIKAVIDVGK
jgi:hypothetical protein